MAPASPEAAQATEAAVLALRDGVVMLGAAMLFVTVFRRFGLGAVLGYLIAGALVGPDGLGLVHAGEALLHIADFGIVLLLFLVRSEEHTSELQSLMRISYAVFCLKNTTEQYK